MPVWKKSRKGSADIHKTEGLSSAIVDRRGMGINAALGANITFDGDVFETVEAAKAFAEKRIPGEPQA